MAQIIFILFLIFSVLLLNGSANGSSFDDFNKYIKGSYFKKAKAVLDNWGKDKDNDPQYYICLFNYHFNKSRSEAIGIQKDPPENEKTIQITDPKTGEIVGYFAPNIHYDSDEAQKGINHIKTGISRFPNHYEMRFGLLYAYKELNQFKEYLTELENGLSYFKKNNLKKIYWNNNEIISNPADFIIETVQGNFSALVENRKMEDKNFMFKYCDLLIKYFPKHKYGYSNKGVVYYRNNNFKQALEYFLKAYSLDPKDELVAFNIGFLYKEMNDKNNARKYFKKVVEIGKDNFYIEGAKEQLKLLEK